MKSLDKIGKKYKTDKSSRHHNYLIWYEKYFSKLRGSNVDFFEIGISHGNSAKMWIEYFTNGNMVFMDIFKGDHYESNAGSVRRVKVDLKSLGATIVHGSQYSSVDLDKSISASDGGFDIVIDDASHVSEHQQFSMSYLYPHMKPGSIYCIEDLQCKRKNSTEKTVDVIKRFIKTGTFSSDVMSSDEEKYIINNTISFYCG